MPLTRPGRPRCRPVLTALPLLVAVLVAVTTPPAHAQDTHRARVIIDGVDLTEQVYDEPPLPVEPRDIPNFRAQMRDILNTLAEYAHQRDPAIRVLVRNGGFLVTQHKRERDLAILKIPPGEPLNEAALLPLGAPHRRFVRNIDALVSDQRYCPPEIDTRPAEDLARLRDLGMPLFTLEHCKTPRDAAAALTAAAKEGVLPIITLAEGPRRFDRLPMAPPPDENPHNVGALSEVRNALALLDTRAFESRDALVAALARTNHDLLIVEPFFDGNQALSADQVHRLSFKSLGAKRLVFARLTVALADDTRHYWQKDWGLGNPPWLEAFMPEESGRYWVTFTHPDWLALVGETFAGLLDLGYDGIMLDGVTALFRNEVLMPL